MKLLQRRVLLPCLALAVTLGAVAPAPAQEDPLLEGEAVVRLWPGENINEFNAQYGTQTIMSIESRNIHRLRVPEGTSTDHFVNQVQGNPPPSLWWIEGSYAAETGEGKTGSFYVSGIYGTADFHGQWAWSQINLGSAHALTQGDGIVIAVLDTGVEPTHPYFNGRILSTGYNFVDRNGNTDDVRDFIDNDGDNLIDESWGHGTFCAGLILRMAPAARILPVKVLNSDGVGDTWIISEGVFFAIDSGAHVINMSLGTTYRSRLLRDALAEASSKGIAVVGSAGNLNSEMREHPAAFSEGLGVAATDQADLRAPFSSYYNQVNLSAPGVDILGTIPLNDDGHRYAAWDGTSFSSALAAGAAALVMAANPDWPANDARIALVFGALEESAAALPGDPEGMGEGRLDVGQAVVHEPSAAALEHFNILSGTHVSGDLSSLRRRNDDDFLVINSMFGFTAQEPNLLELRVRYTVIGQPIEIEIKITGWINNPGGAGRVRLRNWNTSGLDQVGVYSVPRQNERVRFDDIPAAAHVRSDGRLVVQIRHVVAATFSVSGFRSHFDEVEIGLD